MSSTTELPHRALGEAVKSLRAKDGLTQEDLSERSGLHPTEISRIESGKRSPQPKTMRKLAAGLAMPYWCLAALDDGLTLEQVNRLRQLADSF
jgi:transcriptional regulator with XRE-family HTH domain